MTAGAGVTAVVPAYRAARTIRRAVDSILADPADAQVVVVIDGAFDDTAALLARYPSERVAVIDRQDNWGASRTRNQGLERAATPYLMFVDADDFVEDGLIAGLLSAMVAQGADIGFGPMQILYEKEGRRLPRFVPDFASSDDVFHRWHGQGVYVNPTSVMWRTAFIRGIGGWDPEITRNDDGELVMRAILKGASITVSEAGQGVYVQHSATTMNHRTDTMDSLLRVNDKLLNMPSTAVSPELKREVCARHAFTIAWHAYLAGREDVGAAALRQSRALGFTGFAGPAPIRLMMRTLGLARTAAIGRGVKRQLRRGR